MMREKRSIAVVDDEPEIRRALSRLLQALGFRVYSFASGDEFLANGAGAVDCVLLDLHMPAMSGLDVLSGLARNPAQPPVLLITGHDEVGNFAQARSRGAADYLLKPIDQSTLVAAIDRVTATSARH